MVNDNDLLLVNDGTKTETVTYAQMKDGSMLNDNDKFLINDGSKTETVTWSELKEDLGSLDNLDIINPGEDEVDYHNKTGTGTQVDPFILATDEFGPFGIQNQRGSTEITITGTHGQLISWEVYSGGADRWVQPFGVIGEDGTWKGYLYYTDNPETTTPQDYVGILKLGELYFQWTVKQLEGVEAEFGNPLLINNGTSADRFKNEQFDASFDLTVEGQPVATKKSRVEFEGTFNINVESSNVSSITKDSDTVNTFDIADSKNLGYFTTGITVYASEEWNPRTSSLESVEESEVEYYFASSGTLTLPTKFSDSTKIATMSIARGNNGGGASGCGRNGSGGGGGSSAYLYYYGDTTIGAVGRSFNVNGSQVVGNNTGLRATGGSGGSGEMKCGQTKDHHFPSNSVIHTSCPEFTAFDFFTGQNGRPGCPDCQGHNGCGGGGGGGGDGIDRIAKSANYDSPLPVNGWGGANEVRSHVKSSDGQRGNNLRLNDGRNVASNGGIGGDGWGSGSGGGGSGADGSEGTTCGNGGGSAQGNGFVLIKVFGLLKGKCVNTLGFNSLEVGQTLTQASGFSGKVVDFNETERTITFEDATGTMTPGEPFNFPAQLGEGTVQSVTPPNTVVLNNITTQFPDPANITYFLKTQTQTISSKTMYGLQANDGSISDISLQDPGFHDINFTVNGDTYSYTVKMPDEFPGGTNPDDELTAGSSIAVNFEVANPAATETLLTNRVEPS